ncbi:MAG: hypothetical protein R3F61_00655 [Myxococcota bacterium]
MRGLLLVLAIAGCKGPDGETDDTAIQWGPPKPFQVSGEAGSVVVTRLDYPGNPRVDVYGLFASSTQGYQTAASCAQFAMPCLDSVPELGEYKNLNGDNFRARSSDYRWVGDRMSVGAVQAEFVLDEERGMAFYKGSDESRPELPQTLRFGGEWANFDLPAVEFVNDFVVTGPVIEVDQRIDLSGSEDIEFTWESDGQNEVWLWFQGPRTRKVYHLRDTGSFTLNPNVLNLDDTEVVEVGLAAVTRKSFDVAGNALEVLTLTGGGWKGSACGAFLDVPLEGNTLPPGDPPTPVFMGWGFTGIIDENVHDYIDPDTNEPASARITFTFYDFDFNQICKVDYDASNAARRTPLITDTNARLFQTFDVALFNGVSTCPQVNPLIYGTSDLRNYIEQFEWGFAVGEMIELEEPLSQAYGESWANQAPYIYSMYWTQDGLFGDEQGYGYAFATDTCYRGAGGPFETPDPDKPLPAGFYTSYPYFVETVP